MQNNFITNKLPKIFNENIIISTTDTKWIIKSVSKNFCEIAWYSREELIWQPHNMVRHLDTPRAVFKKLRETIQAWKTWSWTVKNTKKDWTYYWVQAVVEPIFNEEKEITWYVSVRTDITKIIDSINELNMYKKWLNEFDYFTKLDKKFNIKFINEKFLKSLWYRKEDIIWKNIFDEKNNKFSLNNFSEKDIDRIKNSLKTKKIWKWILKNKTFLNKEILCDSTMIPIISSDKEILEYILVEHDITEIELAKKELSKSYKKLKWLDEKKTEFLNIASHELRTPMTSIKWYLSMMMDWDFWKLNSEQRFYIEKMHDNSDRMINLINDMLNVAKLESEKMQFDLENFDLISLGKSIISDLTPLIKEKSQILKLVSNKEKIIIKTDKNKIRQSIINLLSNANKYTRQEWKIELNLEETQNEIIIKVIDNWFWIEEEDFEKIFEKFWKVENERSKDITWTWLGLPIVKLIITQLKWTINLESTITKWSTFTIIFKK